MISKTIWEEIEKKIIERNKDYEIIDWNLIYATYYKDYFEMKLKRKYKEMPIYYLTEIISQLITSAIGQYFVILKTDFEMKKNWDIVRDFTTKQTTNMQSDSNTQSYNESDPYNLSDNTFDNSTKSESDTINSGSNIVTNEDKSKYLNSLNMIRNWLQNQNVYSKILDKILPLYKTVYFSDCYHSNSRGCLCDDDYGLDYNEVTDLINEALEKITINNEIVDAEAVRGMEYVKD